MSDRNEQPGDVVVVSQLPPPVHGSALMTAAFLGALDRQSIPWRLIDRRFSRTIDEVGRFTPRKVAQGFGLIMRLGGAVARRRPQVAVLFATTRPFSFLVDLALAELLRALRVPVVLYLQAVGFAALAQRGPAWRRLVRRLFGSAAATVVLGESLAWDVDTFFDGRVDVIGNTLSELPPASAMDVPLGTRDAVVFLSNLIPGKGHDDFLAVAEMCLTRGVDAKFVLAGGAGPAVAAEVNETISRSGRSASISYVGPVDLPEKWELLARARAFVFPSTYPLEAGPLVMLEAAACGLPIAAYPTGAIAPVLADAGAACVVEAGNRDLLADAIQQIIESPEFADRLGAKAQEIFTESFSYPAYTTAWTRLLERFGVQARTRRDPH